MCQIIVMPLSQDQEDLEHETKVDQMRADIENKYADAYLKYTRQFWKPWKVVVSALLAGGALIGGATGLIGYLIGRAH